MSPSQPPVLRAVLFDFDATLTEPGAIDFSKLKKELGSPAYQPVLEFIHGLSSRDEQRKALRILDRYEMDAAKVSVPNSTAEDLICYLRSKSLPIGIIEHFGIRSSPFRGQASEPLPEKVFGGESA